MSSTEFFRSQAIQQQTPPQSPPDQLEVKFDLAPLLTGALTAIAGGVVLFGWAFDIAILKSLQPTWVSMKPNTALGFIIAGLALSLASRPSSPLATLASRLCTLLIGLLGLLTLCEYLFHWNPGFDQWLFVEPEGTIGTSSPGRMAPNTAICFLLLALSFGIAWDKKKPPRLFASTTLGLLVAIIALADLFCLFTSPFNFNVFWYLTVMATHTAILFTILGVMVAWNTWPRNISPWSLTGRSVTSFAFWTLMLTGSLAWSLQREGYDALVSAMDTARASIRKDISFRKWAVSHGGVYVPPSEQTPPNPYLKIPSRDVVTTTGTALTLMNPAYMLREMQTNFGDDYGTRSRITSLKPLNPNNAPDPWEASALTRFERKEEKELSEVKQINGQPYLRMMVPFVIEAGCLKCHNNQGFALGDIRGGIDCSVPLAPLLTSQKDTRSQLFLIYGVIWALGTTGLTFFYQREHRLALANEQEKAFSEAVINSLPGTFYAYEDGQRLVRWNRNLETLSGYSADELLNRHPLDWVPDEYKTATVAEFNRMNETDEVRFETELVLKEKSVPFLLTGSWLTLGGKRYLIGVGLDLSEQKKLEDGLRQAQKMESLGTLASGIAHDFNNILAAIIGYSDLALSQAQENSPCLKELSEVRQAADRATQLVRQILTFSRKQRAEKNPLQVSLIIKEALKLLRSTIPTTIGIRQEITSQSLVMADPTQIHQVVMNLCTNAYHAMTEQGGVLSVTLKDIVFEQKVIDGDTELPAGRYVLLSVSDSGCGMDQATMGKIFDPYFTTKGEGKGTGLGLAVVHGIVKDHQGRIAVYSEPGQGTTFNVYLPTIIGEAEEEGTGTTPPLAKAHERIMLVDDESTIREALHTILTQAGYQVDIFPNGLAAWQALSQNPDRWDALITDITMPEMTGEQMAAKASTLRPDLPVILCSGYSEILNGSANKKAGIFARLQKPISRNTLLTQLAAALGKRP